MSTFHPFPRLPLELRQHIWAMATEPRLTVVGKVISEKPRPPPPLLGVCREARAYLLRHSYTKAFLENPNNADESSTTTAQYQYVDYSRDTVHWDQGYLGFFSPREQCRIQHLSVQAWVSDEFLPLGRHQCALRAMTSLRDVVIHHWQLVAGDDTEWWYVWYRVMVASYSGFDPVAFAVRILGPAHGYGSGHGSVHVPELNRYNYLGVGRLVNNAPRFGLG
ncbi:hypothetical protein PG996_008787 [Apiospora saccharicola]|uniref:2EXR domain-containing protein n=1 Tax=Apiospora saccharicola TaxID=335842 RepID=A0ABR1UZ05_9PEZI